MSPELEQYLHFFEDFHNQIGKLIAELPSEALNWRPIEDGEGEATNSLAVLVTHVLGAERLWIGEVFGDRAVNRDRDAEFVTTADDASGLQQQLNDTTDFLREVLTNTPAIKLDETTTFRDRTFTRRWGVVHALEHTALHLGHMQLTLQLWQSGQAGTSPRWFERV